MKKQQSEIAIIMATYNGRNTIKDAIDSIISQIYKDWNLIIVNDGGENISDIVNEYNDERIFLINSSLNKGQPHAINIGIKESQSQYIAYLDDDDLWYPNHLELLYNKIINTSSELAYSNTYVVRRDSKTKKEIDRTPLLPAEEIPPDFFLSRNYVSHSAKLHTRKILDKVGLYDESKKNLYENDWDLLRKIVQYTTPIRIKEITTEWNLWIDKNTGAIVNKFGGEGNRNPMKVLNDRTYILDKTPDVIQGPQKVQRLSTSLKNEVLSNYALREAILNKDRLFKEVEDRMHYFENKYKELDILHRETILNKDRLFKEVEDRMHYFENKYKEIDILHKEDIIKNTILNQQIISLESEKIEVDGRNKELINNNIELNNKLNNIYKSITWKVFLIYLKTKNTTRGVAKKDILIISGCPGAVKLYRFINLKEELELLGYNVDMVDMNSNLDLGKLLNKYKVFIFQRVEYTQGLVSIIKKIKTLKKKIIYDIDDYIFIKKVTSFSKYNSHLNDIKKINNIKKFIKISDLVITSTPYLAKELKKINPNIFINNNVQNIMSLNTYNQANDEIKPKDKDIIILGYASGTNTHNDDFEILTPTLIKIFNQYNNVYLKIIGYLSIPKNLLKFENRIIHIKYIDNMTGYINNLNYDINLAPLRKNDFNEGKSCIKYQELGALGIPTIASNVGEYSTLENKTTILLSSNDNEWYQNLQKLITDTEFRKEIGKNAKQEIYKNYTTGKNADKIRELFKKVFK